MTEGTKKGRQGFAAMSPEKRKEIAALGRASIPAEKRLFSKDKAAATKAGRKGGKSVPAEKRSFSKSPELAAAAGRAGGRGRPKRKPENAD